MAALPQGLLALLFHFISLHFSLFLQHAPQGVGGLAVLSNLVWFNWI
jgi:hypothetical protein